MILTTLLASSLSVGQITMEPCFVEGAKKAVECSMLTVPESYQANNGKQVEVHVIRSKAVANNNKAPLFVLAGGPGQAATEMTSTLANSFKEINKQHDIVFVAQRGSGLSNAQPCHHDTQVTTDELIAIFNECHEKLKPIEEQLSTDTLAKDIESVRSALGYDKINLWGGSYGTYAAQHYAMTYSNNVSKMVLDAALAIDDNPLVEGGKYPQQSLERLDEVCQQDNHCAKHFPNWRAQFDELLKTTDNSPIILQFEKNDVSLDSMALAHLVRTVLYSPNVANKLPKAIDAAYNGNYHMLKVLNSMISGAATDTMYTGLTLGVLCQEHVYQGQSQAAKLAGKNSFTEDSYYQFWLKACQTERVQQAESIKPPKQLATPTLLISGTLDPITPEQSAERTRRYLTNTQHIIIPNASHTNSHKGCMPELINEFLLNDEVADTSCITQNRFPPFLK